MEMPASSPFPVFNQTAQQSASSPQPVTETAAERQTRLAGYLAELSAPTKKPPRRLEKKYWSEKDVQFLGTSNISHHVTPRDVGNPRLPRFAYFNTMPGIAIVRRCCDFKLDKSCGLIRSRFESPKSLSSRIAERQWVSYCRRE